MKRKLNGRPDVDHLFKKEIEVATYPKEKPTKINRKSNRRYRVAYELCYDAGWAKWNGYYRTPFGARISIFYNTHVNSWGGTAKLYERTEFFYDNDNSDIDEIIYGNQKRKTK